MNIEYAVDRIALRCKRILSEDVIDAIDVRHSPARQSGKRESDRRVIHLFRTPVGGLFRHVCDLVTEQAKLGLSVGIVCDSSTGGGQAAAMLEKLSEVCRLGVHRLVIHRTPGPADFRVARSISRILAPLEPTIVHGHGAKGAAFARLVAGRHGARTIYTPHGGSLHYSWSSIGGALYLLLERLLRKRLDGVLFESEYTARVFQEKLGKPDCPFVIVHNGLRDDEFAVEPDPDPSFDFAFVGELRDIKGISVLLDAIALVGRDCEAHIAIVGDGEKKAAVDRRAQAGFGLASVEVLDPVFPASTIIRKSKCMVVPSLAESFPYIVLETIAAGIPLIATRVGGIPEIFGPFVDALLPPGDPGALAAAMTEFIGDATTAANRTAALRTHAMRHFQLRDMAQKTNDFYQTVIDQGTQ